MYLVIYVIYIYSSVNRIFVYSHLYPSILELLLMVQLQTIILGVRDCIVVLILHVFSNMF